MRISLCILKRHVKTKSVCFNSSLCLHFCAMITAMFETVHLLRLAGHRQATEGQLRRWNAWILGGFDVEKRCRDWKVGGLTAWPNTYQIISDLSADQYHIYIYMTFNTPCLAFGREIRRPAKADRILWCWPRQRNELRRMCNFEQVSECTAAVDSTVGPNWSHKTKVLWRRQPSVEMLTMVA